MTENPGHQATDPPGEGQTNSNPPVSLTRRRLLMGGVVGSLALAYGFFASFAIRFVFPRRSKRPPTRIFLGFVSEVGVGQSRVSMLPSGEQLLLSNTGEIRPESGIPFVAFSNRCPHLGCRVHWDSRETQFVCPCHQGVFNSNGVATSGPPAQASQSLFPFQLEIEGNSIYVLVEDA